MSIIPNKHKIFKRYIILATLPSCTFKPMLFAFFWHGGWSLFVIDQAFCNTYVFHKAKYCDLNEKTEMFSFLLWTWRFRLLLTMSSCRSFLPETGGRVKKILGPICQSLLCAQSLISAEKHLCHENSHKHFAVLECLFASSCQPEGDTWPYPGTSSLLTLGRWVKRLLSSECQWPTLKDLKIKQKNKGEIQKTVMATQGLPELTVFLNDPLWHESCWCQTIKALVRGLFLWEGNNWILCKEVVVASGVL